MKTASRRGTPSALSRAIVRVADTFGWLSIVDRAIVDSFLINSSTRTENVTDLAPLRRRQTPDSVDMVPALWPTGSVANAMALIAPGAFVWLTFVIQASAGTTSAAMWAGMLFALLLCLATAASYAELSKLYPGTGRSYYFAEQSFLNHERAWRYARLAKFSVGWASHVYYWFFPGVMAGLFGVLCGYIVGTLWPSFMSATNPGPIFMMSVAVVSSFLMAWVAQRGINVSTSVSIAINVIQITALLMFSVMACAYRVNHPPGAPGWQFDPGSGEAYTYEFRIETVKTNGQTFDSIVRDSAGVPEPAVDASGRPIRFTVTYPEKDKRGAFLSHPTPSSVVGIHNVGWMFAQGTIAILILVGFESVMSSGGEAKRTKSDVPTAVMISLLVQGVFCYMIEYFSANYFLNRGYTMQSASRSAAPIGDMMIMVGDAFFGQGAGRIFMLMEALTVVLAVMGTILACLNTGARVTYAMAKEDEIPEYYGILHPENLTPHRAIWTLAIISAVVGCISVSVPFGDASALSDTTIMALPKGLFSSTGYPSHNVMAALPNTLLTMILATNFGTFLLYAMTCVICVMAFHKHPSFNPIKHLWIPLVGLSANLACMAFYLIAPVKGYGTKTEPVIALGITLAWFVFGGIYFIRGGVGRSKQVVVQSRMADM